VSALDSGQRVGRYQILRFLGAGAMGEVYLAEDPHIERRLAIKTVRIAGGRPQDIEDRKRRLLREARAAGKLLHPHVVTLFDTGEDDGLLYLAFEFVEGCDLASRLETGPPPVLREVLRVVRQVAEALDYAHRHGIVHRDIKPSNILIDTSGNVKVADFGIAKVAGQNTELTVVGSVMGSPQYLSPEQIRGDELDGRSDVFSLGVVLYELLSGRRPFDGETITTLVYQILHKDPSIAELRAVPLRLEQLLHRMMAKDRDARLATAGLVAEELAAIERELPEETLASPAAPAAEALDATRVLPARSSSLGAVPAGVAGAAAGSPPRPGGSASTVPDGVAATAAAGAGAGSGGTGTGSAGAALAGPPGAIAAGAAAAGQAGSGQTGSPLAGVFPPSVAPAVSAAPAATAAPSAPAPAGRRSSAKVWLALAAVVLLLCGVLAVGAFLFWQRFLSGLHAAASRTATPPATAGGTAPAVPGAPAMPTAGGALPPTTAAGPRTPAGPASKAPHGTSALPSGREPSPPSRLQTAPSPPPQAIVVQRITPPPAPAGNHGKGRGAGAAAGTAAGAAGDAGAGSQAGGRAAISISSRPQPAPSTQSAAASRAATAKSAATPDSGASAKNGAPGTTASATGAPNPAARQGHGGSAGAAGGATSAGSSTGAGSAATGAAAGRPQPQAVVADAGAGAGAGTAGSTGPGLGARQGQGREAAAEAAAAAVAGAASPSADRVIRSGLELAFRVNPPDAIVLLDGGVIGRADEWNGLKGGRAYTLPGSGSHLVKIKRPGMKDYRIAIEATDVRGTTPVVVNLQPLPAAQVETVDLQTVRVREAIALHVRPEVNAVVLVDGAPAGAAKSFAGRFGHAEEWLSLSPGLHRVTLVAPGYGRRDLAVEVSAGAERAREKIDVALSPATGTP
jgi:serine/threonine-protein kinase